MGTVGINFGSATSGAGFDVAATVTAIQSSQGAIETPWKTQLTALAAQDTALSSIGKDLATLTTSLQALTDFTGVTAQKAGSSSNSDVVQLLGATSQAVPGSYAVNVSQLEQTATATSSYFGKTDTFSGSLVVTGPRGLHATITPAATDTAADIAAAINAANLGLTASTVTDGVDTRLSFVSNTQGAGDIAVDTSQLTDSTRGGGITIPTYQHGRDATVNVNGVAYDSKSNTITTAIPGVTFQLLSVTNTTTNVQITGNNAAVESAVNTLVNSYNAVVKDLKTQEGKDASGNAEPLYGSPTLALIQSQLVTAFSANSTVPPPGAPANSINNLAALGINYNTDGTLTLSADTLSSALTSNYSGVVDYFQATGSFGLSFTTALNNLGTQGPGGAIYIAQQQNTAQEKTLNASVKNEDAQLAAQKLTLTAELTLANQELQSIPSQLNQINEIYSAISGYSKVSQ